MPALLLILPRTDRTRDEIATLLDLLLTIADAGHQRDAALLARPGIVTVANEHTVHALAGTNW